MEKALTKVGSLKVDKALSKVGSFWISKKAKKEISSIGEDLSRFSNTVEEKAKWVFEKLKGKPSRSLPELLHEYGLPQGLFPRNIICYEFDELSSKLIVHLPSPCEISFKDSSVLRYATRVKATLSRGKLSGIEGMKTKLVVWVKVTQVNIESHKSDKICFMSGVKKLRPKDAYEMLRDSSKHIEYVIFVPPLEEQPKCTGGISTNVEQEERLPQVIEATQND